jgi:hypothetical protein
LTAALVSHERHIGIGRLPPLPPATPGRDAAPADRLGSMPAVTFTRLSLTARARGWCSARRFASRLTHS